MYVYLYKHVYTYDINICPFTRMIRNKTWINYYIKNKEIKKGKIDQFEHCDYKIYISKL